MLSVREDVIGVGAILRSVPKLYTPDNIILLIERMHPTPFSLESFLSHSKSCLGLEDSIATMLFEHFQRLFHPFGSLPDDLSLLAAFGMFLVLQFLSEFSHSPSTRLKSLRSDGWLVPQERIFSKASTRNPLSPRPTMSTRSSSEHDLAQRKVKVKVSRIYSDQIISASPELFLNSSPPPSPSHNQTGPSTIDVKSVLTSLSSRFAKSNIQRKHTPQSSSPPSPQSFSPSHSSSSSFTLNNSSSKPMLKSSSSLNSIEGVPRHKLKSEHWRLAPPSSHQFFPSFQISFILEYISTLVRICLSAVGCVGSPSKYKVTTDSINDLGFLLCTKGPNSGSNYWGPSLHSYLECFQKDWEVSFFDAVSSVSKLLKSMLETDSVPMNSKSTHCHFCHHKTIIMDNEKTNSNQQYLNITNSFRSFFFGTIYRHCGIACITNCTVFVGAVAGVFTVQNCAGSIFIVCCHSLSIVNCKDCVLYLATNTKPVFMGENCNIKIAPFNAFYPKHAADLESAKINLELNYWNEPVSAFLKPMKIPSIAVSLLPPNSFQMFSVPFVHTGDTTKIVFPLPSEFETAIIEREEKVKRIREQLHQLQETTNSNQVPQIVWSRFKEWFSASGYKTHIEDLTKLDLASGNK
eukprot:c18574_g1_i1.p1 GENE.c18574_g1_i1~~c18574_g1_i1.p1  ORF type:complete len:632 (+),score=245.81 c18574_g1_i1:126-2021(+)